MEDGDRMENVTMDFEDITSGYVGRTASSSGLSRILAVPNYYYRKVRYSGSGSYASL